jgi:hypothetical protein
MDTTEQLEIQHAQRLGHPETDEGPYYHDSWWESYKGSVKGKLGGVVIGAAMGAAVGVAAAIAIPFVGGALLTTGALAMTVSGFTAAGMLYGAHEFADVGRVTGAVAAGLETAERRNDVKLAKLENKIDKLQSTITGEPIPADAQAAADKAAATDLDYKTTHCDDHQSAQRPPLVFWKVALIGLAIGAAAGLLLASGGVAGHVLGLLGAAGEGGVLSTVGVYAASALSMGLFGASFGVNRDMFRSVFDKTDLMFRGIVSKSKASEQIIEAPAPAPVQQAVQTTEKSPEVVAMPAQETKQQSQVEYPASETYHRDKVVASARQALLTMDHTKAISH